jgi:hypothetical protein
MAGAIVMAGCSLKPHEKLNSPPQGHSERPSPSAAPYAYMGDNAMLADMSLSDIHFVPHQSVLSGTGEARLARYAELLASTGGRIRYRPSMTDPELIASRLGAARQFMAQQMASGGSAIEFETGMSGGDGVNATHAQVAFRQGMAGYGERQETPQAIAAGGGSGAAGGGGGASGGAARGGSSGGARR